MIVSCFKMHVYLFSVSGKPSKHEACHAKQGPPIPNSPRFARLRLPASPDLVVWLTRDPIVFTELELPLWKTRCNPESGQRVYAVILISPGKEESAGK